MERFTTSVGSVEVTLRASDATEFYGLNWTTASFVKELTLAKVVMENSQARHTTLVEFVEEMGSALTINAEF